MRVSEENQQKTKLKILDAAVDVFIEKGVSGATMREIARRAQIGDATIYTYFPTKEKLLYGYCAQVQRNVITALKAIPDFHTLNLHEQLSQIIETQLQEWLGARELLAQIYKMGFNNPIDIYSRIDEVREIFYSIIIEIIDAAIEANEIPDQPYREIFPRLMYDYLTGIFAYWLNDESDNFENTSKLVDQTTLIIVNILEAALLGKAIDVFMFIYRSQILSRLEGFRKSRETLKTIKRKFMEGHE
jgi:AcrR family transcriptional regulator